MIPCSPSSIRTIGMLRGLSRRLPEDMSGGIIVVTSPAKFCQNRCVCVCVCGWVGGRGWEGGSVCVCVCVWWVT